jgi:hypothetical protein
LERGKKKGEGAEGRGQEVEVREKGDGEEEGRKVSDPHFAEILDRP